MIVCDVEVRQIRRHSRNADAFFPAARFNGHPLDELIGPSSAHEIRNALLGTATPSRPALVTGLTSASGDTFDVAVHEFKGNAILEFERTVPQSSGAPLQLSRNLVSRLKALPTAEAVLSQTPRFVRGLLQYDRVMIYRFAHDGSGEVVSEAKRSDLESFLGQRFPASDIPQQARDLYRKNTIRVIGDIDDKTVAIDPERDSSGEPLDLSFAHLRSVSPIHCEYLRNMGVAASMSVSIIVGGELWGLIACHHYSPRALTMSERVAAEMFGDFFSLTIEGMRRKSLLDAALKARQTLDGILREASYHSDVRTFLRERLATFADIISCDGVGLWIGGTWQSWGNAPSSSLVPALARFANATVEGRVWATHEISAHLRQFADRSIDVAGLLAVPVSQVPRDYLFFFRKEVIETVNWAGNPNKQYDVGPHGDRLTPRQSFAIWKETVEHQSQPWTLEDREAGESVRTALLEVIMRQTEILAAERRKADVRQKILNEELNHRVKNILALIKSLVSRKVEQDETLESYVDTLRGRIVALAFAHDQVIRSDGGGSLRRLLEAELTPYRGTAEITLDGPDIGLDARAYSVMALVFHELATNAAKYGALSKPGGKLMVKWNCRPKEECGITWTERGGPPVSPPTRRGFGSVLVDRSVPYDLGGESELKLEADGASARFVIPGKFVSVLSGEHAEAPATQLLDDAETAALSALKVLVVEDQLLIAMDVETALAGAGVKIINTAATAAEGLKIISIDPPQVAVLDVNLGAGTSIPVAEELIRLDIPFIFATGYGDTTHIPRSMHWVPVLRKPYEAATLIASLAAAVHAHDAGRSGTGAD